jgi:murein DD-endopeptidase MepM/ murein hydrolase activator NlpD
MLGVALCVLVGVNVYVFLIRPGNLRDLKRRVQAGRIAAGEPGVGEPSPSGAPSLSPDGRPVASAAVALGGAAGEPGAELVAGRRIEGKVEKGDTLGRILAKAGLEPPEQAEVVKVMTPVFDPKTLRIDQRYLIHFDDEGRLDRLEWHVSATTVVVVTRGPGGALSARRAEAKTEIEIHEVSGTIKSSLYEAVRAQGESTELVAELADLFAAELNFYIDTHEGDRFSIIVEKERLGGQFLGYGRILAAEYRGNAGTVRAFWYQGAGAPRGGYFDEDGQSMEKSMLKTPLKFARVSSGFNPRRMHPVLHRVKGHFGTDFAAPTGTPVWAAGDAVVVSAAAAGGAGNLVVLDHGGGLRTYYMHLSKFARGLRAGQRVKQKQVIGYVGTTGLSTGPHLHLGVQQGGKWVDWNRLKPRRSTPIARSERDTFQREIAARVAALGRLSGTAVATTDVPRPQ